MKKIVFALVFIFSCLGVHAQLGYWGSSGFVELTPDESFVYKFVMAMDNKSQQVINDLYASMKKTGDKSILKCTEISKGAWYVKKDYPLPEGNYFESDFYNAEFPNDSHENELMIILPQIQHFMNNSGRIEDLLEYLGDRVTVDLISVSDISGSTDFRFISNLKTSEEWLKLCLDVYNHGFDGLHYFIPQHLMINRSYCSHLIGVMTDANDDEKLIYSMNWEGVEYPAACEDPDDPWKTTDEGLALLNPEKQEFAGSNTILISTGGFSLEEHHDYMVRLNVKVPSDGTYVVNMGSWLTNCIKEVPVSASDDFQVIDIPFSDFWGDITDREFKPIEDDAHVRLAIGLVAGTTVVKKVEVYEVVGSGARGGDKTAINAVKATNADGAIYNLAGQKVDASYKGIIIHNGKKRIAR